ncbi:hypothetical protein H2200_006611 [Cladophialophora chaetospira]|uniref:Uncharacterized protein n=1 Tax=Cladophialophora chaetospira TaxID=386627 RepID=A0AA38X8Q7_9EURO|nr:hypothetical protein H2200_006611 [Cladophialophora chaetospira]
MAPSTRATIASVTRRSADVSGSTTPSTSTRTTNDRGINTTVTRSSRNRARKQPNAVSKPQPKRKSSARTRRPRGSASYPLSNPFHMPSIEEQVAERLVSLRKYQAEKPTYPQVTSGNIQYMISYYENGGHPPPPGKTICLVNGELIRRRPTLDSMGRYRGADGKFPVFWEETPFQRHYQISSWVISARAVQPGLTMGSVVPQTGEAHLAV